MPVITGTGVAVDQLGVVRFVLELKAERRIVRRPEQSDGIGRDAFNLEQRHGGRSDMREHDIVAAPAGVAHSKHIAVEAENGVLRQAGESAGHGLAAIVVDEHKITLIEEAKLLRGSA